MLGLLCARSKTSELPWKMWSNFPATSTYAQLTNILNISIS